VPFQLARREINFEVVREGRFIGMGVFNRGKAALRLAGGACLALSISVNALSAGAAVGSSGTNDIAHAQDEAISMLKEYLKIDTSNPPGNETKGAAYLAKILNDNGIEAKLFESTPASQAVPAGRSCVYARLKGNGKKKAVVLLNHIDVVPAKAEDWKHAPFAGEEIDGEIWGRGSVDMKSMGIAELESMLTLKRSGKTLDRDIIFLGTPDEEVGGNFGADWFVKNHADLVKDAEFLFNEGAFIDSNDDGKPKYCGVAVSEKSVLWLSLKAKGDAGHASMPMPDSSVNRLIRALNKIVENPPKPTVLPPVREFFKRISTTVGEPQRSIYANIDESVKKPDVYQGILKDKYTSSMLRNTISPTVLEAGYKTNVIPAEATAKLDCRILPGVQKDAFIASLKDTMKDNTIDVGVLDWVHTDASPYETECFNVINKVMSKDMPGVPVVPMVMPWFTDSHWFRDLGICSYGFAPVRVDPLHLATMHGKDERIQVANYKEGVKIFYDVMEELCTEKH
jgi:acetylornithine deacetylase/succinyl-diaminopimelate desuccinylase-like protein